MKPKIVLEPGTLRHPITCPHCKDVLTVSEIRSILGQFARGSSWAKEGPNRFKSMTPEQRSEEARKAAKARWAMVGSADRSTIPQSQSD